MGWPKYYSEGSEHKELFLTEAEWHVPKSAANKINKDEEWESKCVQGPGVLLTEFDNVVAIDVIRTEKN